MDTGSTELGRVGGAHQLVGRAEALSASGRSSRPRRPAGARPPRTCSERVVSSGGVTARARMPTLSWTGSWIGLPLERPRVGEGVDVVLAGLVVHEGEPVGPAGPGEHRRQRGDALHAGVEVGELEDVVRRPGRTGRCCSRRSGPTRTRSTGRRGPLRAHVLALVHVVEHPTDAGGQVVERDPPVADRERPEVGLGPAIGGERDGLARRATRPDGGRRTCLR